MYYPATITPHEDGRYAVRFVDLPGCISHGQDLEEALVNAGEALSLHVWQMQRDGDSLPPSSSLENARLHEEYESQQTGDSFNPDTILQYVLVRPLKEKKPVQVTISIKPTILEQVDAAAKDLGVTRSGLIALATRDYIKRLNLEV